MKPFRMFLLMGAAASTLHAGAAYAADGVENSSEATGEITVTARRQSEKLVDVPASVSVITGEQLRNSGIVTTEQAIALTPGVTIVSNAAQVGDAQINIRGVNGARDAESNVALVVDGILKTNTAAVNQYQGDLQQFEVLKGPQGAYYGRNAAAGAIVLTTKKPGDRLEVSARGHIANNDSQMAQASIASPLGENLGFVLFGDYRHTDGFYRNTGPNESSRGATMDFYRGWNVGGRVVATPGDLELDGKVRYGKIKAGALNYNANFSLPIFAAALGNPDFNADPNKRDFVFNRNVNGIDRMSTFEASLKATFDLGGAKLTSWVSYNDIQETFVADAAVAAFGRFNARQSCQDSVADLFNSGYTLPSPEILGPTPAGSVLGAFGPTTCDGIQVTIRDQKDLSAEIRLASDNSSPLQWSLGAYYLNIKRHYATSINEDEGQGAIPSLYNPAGSFNQTTQLFDDNLKTNVYAGFGNLQYKFADAFTASAALRFDREERSVNPQVPNVTDPILGGPINPGLAVGSLVYKKKIFQQAQPKVTLRYEPAPDFNIYADWGVGFKAGGFNSQGSAAIIDQAINQVLNTNVAINDDYKKERSSAFEIGFKARLFNGRVDLSAAAYHNTVTDMQFFEFFSTPQGILRVVSNIDKVRLQGAEAAVNFRVTPMWTLSLAGNVVDSKIKENSVRPSTVGNKSPYTADYTINFASHAEVPITEDFAATFHVDYRITGPTWFHVVQAQTNPTLFGVPGDYSLTQRKAYGILNLRAGVKADNWTLTFFANNAANKKYLEEIIPAPEFGGEFISPGARRMLGVEASVKF